MVVITILFLNAKLSGAHFVTVFRKLSPGRRCSPPSAKENPSPKEEILKWASPRCCWSFVDVDQLTFVHRQGVSSSKGSLRQSKEEDWGHFVDENNVILEEKSTRYVKGNEITTLPASRWTESLCLYEVIVFVPCWVNCFRDLSLYFLLAIVLNGEEGDLFLLCVVVRSRRSCRASCLGSHHKWNDWRVVGSHLVCRLIVVHGRVISLLSGRLPGLFLKSPEKHKNDPRSYRAVFLLPAFGKIQEGFCFIDWNWRHPICRGKRLPYW